MKIVALFFVFFVGCTNPAPTDQSHGEEGEYFEGDIAGVSPYFSFSRNGLANTRFRWPNGLIPYVFDRSYPNNLKQTFQSAIEQIEASTCITFVPRERERDYIRVFAGNGCYSTVGRKGGRQDVSVPRTCNPGSFVHELIHAIGFFHEQSRTDRDDYVRINWDNIEKKHVHNFNKSDQPTNAFGVEYDYGSIMHYSKDAFSSNGKDTITTIPAGIPIGQRDGMSQGDIDKINRMYDCDVDYY